MRITRRQFIKYVSATAAALGLSQANVEQIIKAVANPNGAKVIWLSGQACGGCIEAASNMFFSEVDLADGDGDNVYDNLGIAQVKALFGDPDLVSSTTVEDVLIDVIDLKLMPVIDNPSGDLWTSVLKRYMKQGATNPYGGDLRDGNFVVVVEGSVPSDLNLSNTDYCIIAHDYDQNKVLGLGEALVGLCDNSDGNGAAAVIAYGTCAAYGNIPAARNVKYDPATDKWESSNAMGVSAYLQSKGLSTPVVNVPLCPGHPEAFALTIVDYLTYGAGAVVGNLDSYGRPKKSLAFGFDIFSHTLHQDCPRLSRYYAGVFSGRFGDSRQGCLQKLGCQGQWTNTPCHTLGWNRQYSGTSCIKAGMPCVGCAEHGFPDKTMLYKY